MFFSLAFLAFCRVKPEMADYRNILYGCFPPKMKAPYAVAIMVVEPCHLTWFVFLCSPSFNWV